MNKAKVLAPIGIGTYSRLNHLKRTIESLQKNTLAQESELYIFSDGPKEGDDEIVFKLRKYIHTINGFKKVHIIERKKNDRAFNHRDGKRQLLEQYGKYIYMEDDNVTSPLFLQYMNDGLDFYESDKRIFCICGFNIPGKYPNSIKNDYYLSRFFNGWGYATWNDRNLLKIVHAKNAYSEVLQNKNLKQKIERIHPGLIQGLKKIYEGTFMAGDYNLTYNMIKNDKYAIKPIKSFVNNIGNDGSGMHCIDSNHYNHKSLGNKKLKFNKAIVYDSKIDKIWRHYVDNKPPIIIRIKNLLYKITKDVFN